MRELLFGVLLFCTAMAASYGLTPVSMRLAHRIGAIDIPRDARRMHRHPVPRLGGLAISLSVLFVTGCFLPATPVLRAIWVGGSMITLAGVLDDTHSLPPLAKLGLQLVAAIAAVRCGAVIDGVALFGHYLLLGVFAAPVTILWILLLTNAINLIDGLDGLSCGVSAISALVVLVITGVMDEQVCALTAATLLGACVGFYPHNRHPARTFAGDTGAQYLGFALAVISVDGVFKLPLFLSLLVPPLIFLLPLSDTLFAFARRILRGQSPFHADKGHMHHRLLATGFTHTQTVTLLWLCSGICGGTALMVIGHGIYAIALGLVLLLLWLLYRMLCRFLREGQGSGNEKKQGKK